VKPGGIVFWDILLTANPMLAAERNWQTGRHMTSKKSRSDNPRVVRPFMGTPLRK